MRATLLLPLLLISCQTPKGKALEATGSIAHHALEAQKEGARLTPYIKVEGEKHFDSLMGHVDAIQEEAEGLGEVIPKLENPEGLFSRVLFYLKWGLIVLVTLVALFILAEARLLPGVGWLLSWLASKGVSFARHAKSEAALLFKLRREVKEKAPELQAKTDALIAAKRLSSPSFDGAYRGLDK